MFFSFYYTIMDYWKENKGNWTILTMLLANKSDCVYAEVDIKKEGAKSSNPQTLVSSVQGGSIPVSAS